MGHRRAAKAALREFKTCTFVPKIARERKAGIDKLLLEYKRLNPDFRYIMRNDIKDLKVLIKRASEGSYCPYRNISLEVLGALTPLKTRTKDLEENAQESTITLEEEDSFTSPGRSNRRKNYIPKETIFRNLTAIVDGFEQKQNHQ